MKFPAIKRQLHSAFQTIFWLWNLTFLLIVYMGVLPLIGGSLVAATFTGEVPLDFFLTLVALIAVPTVCTWVAGTRLSQQPLQLIRLFYGVEAPLFLLCLIRLFLLRELTAASTQILATVVLCILVFLTEIFQSYTTRHQAIAWLQVIGHSFMLFTGLYLGLILMFYALPVASFLLVGFFSFAWVYPLWQMLTQSFFSALWFIPLLFILFGFSSTLFVAMPSVLTFLYVHSGYQGLSRFASQLGRPRTLAIATSAVTAWMLVFASLQQQPQVQAMARLERPAQTETAQKTLLAQSDAIRKGLLNAYLQSYRYLNTTKENNHIEVMYHSLGLPKSLSQSLQSSYNHLMSPFLYKGASSDQDKAAKLYAQFFDAPIQKTERDAIQHALQSTANRDEAKAGLLNINQKKVWLAQQQITVAPHGDWADVELYEVYENQTLDQQEVFYSFSMPESAVITGLWLGETANRATRYPFTVSPRGAAQQVYNQEVRQRVDPALLEQVGPRHYRLRAFPIPPKSSFEQPNQPPAQLHLWLTYKVMQQADGWTLPQLGEKRNIFWTKDTQRLQNNHAVRSQTDWLPSFIPASQSYQPTKHQIDLPDGYRISAQPLVEQDYKLPQGQRFAVVLDGSRSMAAHTQALTQTFEWLKTHGFGDSNFANGDADLYITSSPGTQSKRLDDIRLFAVPKMTFYGTVQLQEMLGQFAQLRGNTSYDAILLVTDEGSYELSKDDAKLPKLPAPLWMVHLEGLPPAYDDATLQAIQDSQGGVSTTVPEVLRRLATQAALGSSVVSVTDGYAWFLEPAETSKSTVTSTGNVSDPTEFKPLAARQLVQHLSRKIEPTQLKQLDAIHAIAKQFAIVTPYSSMIVLVNERQREDLKQAEAASDRFQREVENGQEQLSQPFNPMTVSGVPEPEVWMLLVLLAIGLLGISRHQIFQRSSHDATSDI